jgi:hypothetical protein
MRKLRKVQLRRHQKTVKTQPQPKSKGDVQQITFDHTPSFYAEFRHHPLAGYDTTLDVVDERPSHPTGGYPLDEIIRR